MSWGRVCMRWAGVRTSHVERSGLSRQRAPVYFGVACCFSSGSVVYILLHGVVVWLALLECFRPKEGWNLNQWLA